MKSLFSLFKRSVSGAPPQAAPHLPSISDLKDLAGKRVLLRAALNVPLQNGQVLDRFRIERALPTIKHLQGHGAKVIVMAHIGREPTESLRPVYEVLQTEVGVRWGGSFATAPIDTLQNGEVLLLENLRQDPREKQGNTELAEELAALADIYVNDAFAASHRDHASITGIPLYLPAYFGLSFIREYEALREALEPVSPSVFILGGAKFETKLPLVEKLADRYDQVFIGGALANDIYKAKGYEVGNSLTSNINLTNSTLLQRDNIVVPEDVLITGSTAKSASAVQSTETILDAGPETLQKMRQEILKAKTVLWNGPLGNYEKGYAAATKELARYIAASGAKSIVGGGDTVAAIHKLDLNDHFTFLSSAGGAMLTFLETGTLPGIEAGVQKE